MKQGLCRKILYDWWGFRTDITEPRPDKYIICLAPHTSNWDFIIGLFFSWAEGFKCHFMMKKEWFFWPLGPILRHFGGVPVIRSKQTRATEFIAQKAIEKERFHLCITPEGTRSKTTYWKRGFYYIALNAHIPILLYGLDYEQKLIRCTKTFIPTGDVEKDMQEIKEYYKDFKGKYPHKFSV